MKKLSSIMMIALTALAFQACKNGAKENKSASDSANAAKDTTQNVAATGTTSGAAVNANDTKFATTAANDGMAEVNAGKMAQEKAVNPRIKSFATMMVNDHTRVGDELAAIAKTKNIALPASPDMGAKKMADAMAMKSGKDFDKAYVGAMLDGHKKAVKLFEDASKNCTDPDLKAFAVKTLPTLKMHLDSIQAIHNSMK